MNTAGSSAPRSSVTGFTLIELMIVVAIIGIIAAIAYPSYQRNVRESNRSEAHAALTTLAALQERFFSNQNSYAQLGTGCAQIDAATTTEHGFYTISVTLPTTPSDADSDCRIEANHAATYTLTATAAAPPQTNDTGCTSITLTSQGVKGPAGCWR